MTLYDAPPAVDTAVIYQPDPNQRCACYVVATCGGDWPAWVTDGWYQYVAVSGTLSVPTREEARGALRRSNVLHRWPPDVVRQWDRLAGGLPPEGAPQEDEPSGPPTEYLAVFPVREGAQVETLWEDGRVLTGEWSAAEVGTAPIQVWRADAGSAICVAPRSHQWDEAQARQVAEAMGFPHYFGRFVPGEPWWFERTPPERTDPPHPFQPEQVVHVGAEVLSMKVEDGVLMVMTPNGVVRVSIRC